MNMTPLSDKAKIVYAALEKLDATNINNKVNAYTIMDYIIEEAETLQSHPWLQEINETDYVDFTIEVNVKRVCTLLTALAKHDLVIKTEPSTVKIDGTTRSLRYYYLKK